MPFLEPTVYLVDDDSDVRQALAWFLRAHGIPTQEFCDGETLLTTLPADAAGVIVLDLRMPGMSGTTVQNELRCRHLMLPIIYLTGHGDVATAVTALKAGAFDFLEKPVAMTQLLDRVRAAMEFDAQVRQQRQETAQWQSKLAQLTEREREITAMMLQGLTSKEMAARLGISLRTVEVHRSHVLDKLAVRNAVELAARLPETMRAQLDALALLARERGR